MTTFLEEVAGESTWMLPFELGCTNDGNKGTIAWKGATTWRFRIGKTKAWKGPPSFSVVGNGKGEITLVAIGEKDATFDNVGNHNQPRHECVDSHKPPPLESKGIESHTS